MTEKAMKRVQSAEPYRHPVRGHIVGLAITMECGHTKVRGGGKAAASGVMEERLTFPCYNPPQARW